MRKPPSLRDPILAVQKIASDLRDPMEGCPWDKAQDHRSLIRHLIEETYETVDALEKFDPEKPDTIENLKKELGDLFFQIVMHAQLAGEKEHFNLDDVARTISEKLISRHPHVYGELSLSENTSDEVLKNWERLKRKERKKKEEHQTNMLDSIPRSLPALLKAYRLGEKVSRVGFDWSSLEEIKKKIEEENQELEAEISKSNGPKDNSKRIQEEFGDLVFVLVQYARHLKIEPEEAVQAANRKFIQRFSYMEEKLKTKLDNEESITIDDWEAKWDEAKEYR